MTDGNGTPQTSRPDPSLAKRLWRLLRSLRLAVVLMGLIALTCIIGTLVEQGPYDVNKAIAKYGPELGLMIGLFGFFHLYETWWFQVLLALFSLNIAACAIPRLRLNLRSLGFAAAHMSLLFILAGAIIHNVAGRRGRLGITEGEVADSFLLGHDKRVPLGMKLRLDDFEIEYYTPKNETLEVRLPGQAKPIIIPVKVGKVMPLGTDGSTVQVLEYLPHFMRDGNKVRSVSSKPVNPAIKVKLSGPVGDTTRWVFAKFPGFSMFGSDKVKVDLIYKRQSPRIKAFKSHVTVMDSAGNVIKKATILVNSPLKLGRYTLYQSSYDPKTEKTSFLEVLYDPGVPLVFIGFALMPLGMAFTLYVRPLLNRRDRKHVRV